MAVKKSELYSSLWASCDALRGGMDASQWLMHILKSLKRTGKAAVILPHGVLFRGNAEGEIRKALIKTGYIKGIIGLPANLFYGTGIPACIIIIDKEDADERTGIFMIDASHDFVKDGKPDIEEQQSIAAILSDMACLCSTKQTPVS